MSLCRVCQRLSKFKEKTTGRIYCSVECQEKDSIFTLNMDEATDELSQKRHILFMNDGIQLAIQRLLPNEEVTWESHPTQNQFIRVEKGVLTVRIQFNERIHTYRLVTEEMDTIIIPFNTRHILENNEKDIVRFYTVYSPPAHTRKEKEEDDREAGLLKLNLL